MGQLEGIFEGEEMSKDPRQADQEALLAAVGPRHAVTVTRLLNWMRTHPRTAARLISGQPVEMEYAIRPKWGKRLTVQPGYEQAVAKAQGIADRTNCHVEIHHREKPEQYVLGLTVHPTKREKDL